MSLRFECQETGRCCISRGDYGFLFLTPEDRDRLAKHFGISRSEFDRRHCTKDESGRWMLTPVGTCKFTKGTKCGVYEARPTQCRTWPFWPEHMNPKKWDKVAEFCPGMNRGREWSDDEIVSVVEEQHAAIQRTYADT